MFFLILTIHNATFVRSIKVFFHLFYFSSRKEKQIFQNPCAEIIHYFNIDIQAPLHLKLCVLRQDADEHFCPVPPIALQFSQQFYLGAQKAPYPWTLLSSKFDKLARNNKLDQRQVPAFRQRS